MLLAKASAGSQAAAATVTVTVPVGQSLTAGQILRGPITWTATAAGDVARVEFLVNGTVVGVFSAAPYGGTLDTTKLANGAYTFAVRATRTNGGIATVSAAVTVQN